MSGLLGGWPTLPPVTPLRPPRPLPFPLEEKGTLLTARARGGLALGLGALGIGAGDEVLMPAYHHGSEVESVCHSGARPVFYAGTPSLEPDENELDELTGPATRALHLTHFLGFPQDAERWRRWCDERGLLLIEDAAQAWLAGRAGRPVGSAGDLAIFCLYKTVGIPDGAATICRRALPEPAPPGGRASVPVAKRLAAWGAQRLPVGRRLAKRGSDEGSFDAAREFEVGDPGRPPASMSLQLLPRFDFEGAAHGRRLNYERLLAHLRDRVPSPFTHLPESAVPWLFPIRAEDKAGTLARLQAGGVVALNFWSVPHPTLDVDSFPRIGERRATTIGLPVHQGLRPRDVERIAGLVLREG